MQINPLFGTGAMPAAYSAASPAATAADAPAPAASDAAAATGVPAIAPQASADAEQIAQDRATAKQMNDKFARECQTCKERKYQDGSDDSGVSFQTPQNINPDIAASVVASHEQEHVVREQAKAQQEGARVVYQSVVLHSDICPECGRSYISGGTTRTVTKSGGAQEGQDAAGAHGNAREAGSFLNRIA